MAVNAEAGIDGHYAVSVQLPNGYTVKRQLPFVDPDGDDYTIGQIKEQIFSDLPVNFLPDDYSLVFVPLQEENVVADDQETLTQYHELLVAGCSVIFQLKA
ncbi:uncharacterized protein LOC106068509 [Biomphalaria glabrata]|uniref:Uncharacterized protein LOC106068509 n=1 Tax=Biomphalaria glabrata TaxID=6526 RepID=A0A2C9M865_BIOGL|nr:uncharacterized protein LOC106068509 [Biomphalaria glabrata]